MIPENTKNDFSKGNITKTLLGLAIPMTLAQLVNVLYNVIDRIYLSRIQGASMDALTGVGVCLPVITMIIAFANLIGTGGAPLFSIERGRQNTKEAGEIMGNCLTLLLIFSGCLTVIGLIIQEPLLRQNAALRIPVSDDLSVWYGICAGKPGTEFFYQCPGIWQNRTFYCIDRRRH